MQQRLARWYHNEDPHPDPDHQRHRKFLASLTNKTVMERYMRGMNVPMPALYFDHKPLAEVNFRELPRRVVIKPNNGASNKGVALLNGRRNLMNGDRFLFTSRENYIWSFWEREGLLKTGGGKLIAEEFLQDFDSKYAIPRDFKVYAVNGRSQLFQIVDRNPRRKPLNLSFYTRDWTYIETPINSRFPPGPRYERPDSLDELLEISDRISADLKAFMRLDFFLTARGPVFGEFTSYPSAGLDYTPYGDHLMCSMMDEGAFAE
jgi:hypothetical protein